MSLTFRWLGTAGVVVESAGQVLAIDPFFTRPSLMRMLQPLFSNVELVANKLPECHYILVTHSHYDHLLDVPEVMRNSNAVAYGSSNTSQLLRILGIPVSRIYECSVGDKLSLGKFEVKVIRGQHSLIPFSGLFNGELRPNLKPPLHVWDYRMDECLGYSISVEGIRLLVCAAKPQPADVLFAVAQESEQYYQELFQGVAPHVFVPIHWDNFTRSLDQPLRKFIRPGRMDIHRLVRLAQQILPNVNVIIPELFSEYPVEGLARESIPVN